HDCMHVAAVLAQMLQQIDHTPPMPDDSSTLPTLLIRSMNPVLRLHTVEFRPPWLGPRDPSQWADIATVAFEYDEHVRFLDDPSLFAHDPEGQLALLPR
ncbi:helicase, partial [Klebsiella pneumoniae]|nr:helicase [Klebsiella pneumoniae]